jgi:hypothetical protein
MKCERSPLCYFFINYKYLMMLHSFSYFLNFLLNTYSKFPFFVEQFFFLLTLYIYQPTICVIFLSKVIVIVLWDLWFIFQINITVVQVFLNVSHLLQVVEIICMIYLYYKRLMFLVSFDYFNLWIFAIYIWKISSENYQDLSIILFNRHFAI